ncbi:MAG: bifunctional folylpolyglutamate synthase/dihydrofolate synthase [Candidatus Omnitrophica bacterium]|nr:bifunctional folylpolyglutamate synthase/dihydrofolate synthase [Candidatus Omnitrophota bacterium]
MFNYSESLTFLDHHVNFERMLNKARSADFKLNIVREALQKLGNPHANLKCVHIAGSKGKGSTAAMIAAMLKAAGFKTGLYTSPHLYDMRERMRILSHQKQTPDGIFGDEIARDDFARIIFHIKNTLDETLREQLTYFEWLTIAAFLCFFEQQVDWVVLETGLGGRLDATNVVDSWAAVITPIGLEHTQILGDTLGKIAYEKAAIIKPSNKFVVIAEQYPEVEHVIRQKIEEVKATNVFRIGHEIGYKINKVSWSGQDIDVMIGLQKFTGLRMPLLGDCQGANLTAALCVVEGLRGQGVKISNDAVFQGAAAVSWPGRFEIISGKQLFILDVCHTKESVHEFVKTLNRAFPGKKPVVILGISSDKDIQGICDQLKPVAREVIVVNGFHERAHTFTKEELKQNFPGLPVSFFQFTVDALDYIRERRDVELTAVVGSVFLVAQARKIIS